MATETKSLPAFSEVRSSPSFDAQGLLGRKSITNKWFDEYAGQFEDPEQVAKVEEQRGRVLQRVGLEFSAKHGLPADRAIAQSYLDVQAQGKEKLKEWEAQGLSEEQIATEAAIWRGEQARRLSQGFEEVTAGTKTRADKLAALDNIKSEAEAKATKAGWTEGIKGGVLSLLTGGIGGGLAASEAQESAAEKGQEIQAEVAAKIAEAGITEDELEVLESDLAARRGAFEEPAVVDSQGQIFPNMKTLATDPEEVREYIRGLDAPLSEKERWLVDDVEKGTGVYAARDAAGERYAEVFNKSEMMKLKNRGEFDKDSALLLIQDADLRKEGARDWKDWALRIATLGGSQAAGLEDPLAQTKLLGGTASVLSTGGTLTRAVTGWSPPGLEALQEERRAFAELEAGADLADTTARQIMGGVYQTLPQMIPMTQASKPISPVNSPINPSRYAYSSAKDSSTHRTSSPRDAGLAWPVSASIS